MISRTRGDVCKDIRCGRLGRTDDPKLWLLRLDFANMQVLRFRIHQFLRRLALGYREVCGGTQVLWRLLNRLVVGRQADEMSEYLLHPRCLVKALGGRG